MVLSPVSLLAGFGAAVKLRLGRRSQRHGFTPHGSAAAGFALLVSHANQPHLVCDVQQKKKILDVLESASTVGPRVLSSAGPCRTGFWALSRFTT